MYTYKEKLTLQKNNKNSSEPSITYKDSIFDPAGQDFKDGNICLAETEPLPMV